MCVTKLYPWLVVALALSSLAFSRPDAEEALNRAYAQAVSGDVRPVLSVLDSIEGTDGSEYSQLVEKYQKRFVERTEVFEIEDPFISKLYQHYTDYWRVSLLNPKKERKARRALGSNLKYLIREFDLDGAASKAIDAVIIAEAKRRGYYLQMGVVAPLRELMIWEKEEKEAYQVAIDDETMSLDVVFMQDFLCKGWLSFATFDEKHTGGWAKEETIYRVGGKPKDGSEWFRVSLLGHEGRHVSDMRKYPRLPSWKLEYRAKLTELTLAEASFWNLLGKFKREAKPKKTSPHSYASYLLVSSLIENLGASFNPEDMGRFDFEAYSKEQLQELAKDLLDESTKSLEEG